jgi:hypothetical protein
MNVSLSVFLRKIWKQSPLILVFAVLGTGVMAWQASRKPELYKFSQTLTVAPFKLKSSNTGALENEIALGLYAQIEGNAPSSIKNLIEENNLFKEERAAGQNLDALAKKLADGLEVDNITANENSLTAFDLSYISANRENARAVVAAVPTRLGYSPARPPEQSKIKVLSQCCEQTKIIAPKRWLMITFGLFAGILTGVLFAAALGKLKYYKGGIEGAVKMVDSLTAR